MAANTYDAIDPVRFLELANELAQSDDEIKSRTAVGRAYYAIFLIARDRMHITAMENVHHIVLTNIKNQIGGSIKNQFPDMQILRHVADYEMVPINSAYTDWRDNWIHQIGIANRLLPHIQKLKRA